MPLIFLVYDSVETTFRTSNILKAQKLTETSNTSNKSTAKVELVSYNDIKSKIAQAKKLETTNHVRKHKTRFPQKFKARSDKIKSLCKRHSFESLNKPDKWRNHAMSYLNRLRTFACLIPKAGCTNWRRTFVAVWKRKHVDKISPFTNSTGKFDSGFYKIVPQFANNKHYSVTDLDKIGIESRWWNRMITVRHPFSRLYSVWMDKFHVHPNKLDYTRQLASFKKLAKRMNLIIGKENSLKQHHIIKDENSMVDFETFLRFIAYGEKIDDPHWGSYYKLCAPCDINYNIIIKLETLDSEIEDVFRILKVPKFVGKFPSGNFHSGSKNVTDELVKNIYRSLPNELVLDLYEHYREDFILFDYEIETWLNRT